MYRPKRNAKSRVQLHSEATTGRARTLHAFSSAAL